MGIVIAHYYENNFEKFHYVNLPHQSKFKRKNDLYLGLADSTDSLRS